MKNYKSKRRKNLMRCKTYAPAVELPFTRYQIIDRESCKDTVVLLCYIGLGEYCIYTDLLIKDSVPCDSYAGSLRKGIRAFLDIIK